MDLYLRNENTLSDKLHEETIMIDVDREAYFSLNPVAVEIWDFLEVSHSGTEIIEDLLSKFDVDAKVCKKEVFTFLDQMIKLKLITKEVNT